MKIIIKPLKQLGEEFDLEVAPDDLVEVLKAKVQSVRPDLPADLQKLVFSGKILQDGQSLQASGVKEGDFLVMMKLKAPAGAAPAATPAAPAPTPAAAPAASAAPFSIPAQQVSADSVGGQQMDATIKMMCDMGFPKSDVERALRAAFGNPDRAVEYLMSGIPPHLMQQASGQPAPQPAQAPAPAPNRPQAGAQPGMFPPMLPPQNPTGPLAKLQTHPMFFRLKAAVQQQPEALNRVLSHIYDGDPSMIPLIAEHQEEFVALMAEPLPVGMPGMPPQRQGSTSTMGSTGTAGTAGTAGAAGAAPPAPGVPNAASGGQVDVVQQMLAALGQQQQQPQQPQQPVPPQVPAPQPAAAPGAPAAQQMTDDDDEAIAELMSFGFDKEVCVQAYLACNKNKESAANLLLDSN